MRAGLIILCLTAAGTSTAASNAPSANAHDSESFLSRHISRAHRAAIRRSSGLARDLRVAFTSILSERSDPSSGGSVNVPVQQHLGVQKPYCVSGGKNTSPANGGAPGATTNIGPTITRTVTRSATVTSQSAPAQTFTSEWKLWKDYAGRTFFDEWDFFDAPDPTNGIVDYLNEADSRSSNLAYINEAGNVVMAVETTPNVANLRKSVRITTKATFDGAIVVLDALHMPTGCGTWPAFWTNGPNWPYQGEIDIVEGVHDYIANQAAVHTDTGCTISSDTRALNISGELVAQTNCAAYETGNQGCGMRASNLKSFGAPFNANGGGMYAMVWDKTGVAVYFWEPGQEPKDLVQGTPIPSLWSAPMARWPASGCDPFKFFKGHSVIFDTTLCGDWAGGAWGSAGIPGQEQSCAQRTGFQSCEAFVRAHGEAFNEAYWEVRGVKIYQLKN